MKLNSALIVWAFTAAFVVAAGCTSFGGGTPSPTVAPAAGAQNTVIPGSSVQPTQGTYVLPVLTDTQKSQAESLAKANDTVKRDIMSKPYLSVTDIYADYPPAGSNDVVAHVTFEGRDSAHNDDKLWMPEQYSVFVDLTTNKVTLITHIEPKPLPTAPPK
jgi:hypothetical protein